MKSQSNKATPASYEDMHAERGILQSQLSKPYSFPTHQARVQARSRFKELTTTLNQMYRETRGL